MKVLVTGCAGFLGSWICERLIAGGHSVIGVDNLSGGYEDNLQPFRSKIDFNLFDITTSDYFRSRQYDIVYHCAALAYEGLSVFSPSLIVNNIMLGSVNVMLDAIRNGARRVINCSSMARYGNARTLYGGFDEWQMPRPVDPYGAAKLAAEQQMTLLGMTHLVHVIHAVPHNIYGPRQRYDDPYRNVVSIMINRILQNKPPIIYGDGLQTRCFSHIDDVLPVMMQLLDARTAHGEVFNVGPDQVSTTILELATTLLKMMNREDLAPIHVPGRPCEVKHATCRSDKIRHKFGFKQMVSLVTGLQSVIEYVKKRGSRSFDYRLPIELSDSPLLPKTWGERLI